MLPLRLVSICMVCELCILNSCVLYQDIVVLFEMCLMTDVCK